jgi:hypothetical protein
LPIERFLSNATILEELNATKKGEGLKSNSLVTFASSKAVAAPTTVFP